MNMKMKTKRIYDDNGEYVGFIKDRGWCGNTRFAFCLKGGAVLYTRATYLEVVADIRRNVWF